jgi:hypothetical protein
MDKARFVLSHHRLPQESGITGSSNGPILGSNGGLLFERIFDFVNLGC